MTLAEFVAARLTEHWEDAQRNIGAAEHLANTAYGDPERTARALAAVHVAHRAVRVIEAQRRTLARHSGCGEHLGYCGNGGHGLEFDGDGGKGCADLVDLAEPDHLHPDFNPAWKDD